MLHFSRFLLKTYNLKACCSCEHLGRTRVVIGLVSLGGQNLSTDLVRTFTRILTPITIALSLLACADTSVPAATPLPIVPAAPTVTAAPAATEVTTSTAFETPISNQVEVHEEGEAHDDGHEGENHTGEGHTHLDPARATAEMGVALVPSELVVGKNRFAVGLFDADGQAVNEAEVHFHYYDLRNPNAPVLESHVEAIQRQTADGLTTIFTQDREFADAGDWGVEIQATFPDGSASIKRIGFQVLADSPSPMPGEKAPSVDTLVSSDANSDFTKLTSALTPNPAFYQESLADAITNGKPTLLLFATPAFCQTRFCGPSYEIANALQQKYGDQLNFVHVEIYTGLPDPASNNWEIAPAMTEFGLSTEPWLFLLDRDGVVVYRVEGLFTVDEIEQYLPSLVGS